MISSSVATCFRYLPTTCSALFNATLHCCYFEACHKDMRFYWLVVLCRCFQEHSKLNEAIIETALTALVLTKNKIYSFEKRLQNISSRDLPLSLIESEKK